MAKTKLLFLPLIQTGIITFGLTCNALSWAAEITPHLNSPPQTPINALPSPANASTATAATPSAPYKAALNSSLGVPMSIAAYTPPNSRASNAGSGTSRNEDKLGELIARLATEHASAERPSKSNGSGNLQDITNRAGDLVMHALGMLGINYKRGGDTPESGLDCSGMVRYVFKQALGHELPRSAAEISQVGVQINPSDLQPGDLVFYNTMKNNFSHVGIYLGDGKFIHSPSAGGQVRIESMSLAYWTKRFNGARRMP